MNRMLDYEENLMMNACRAAVAVSAALLVALAGCGGPPTPSAGDGPSETTGPTDSTTAPVEGGSQPSTASLTDKYTYPDGVQVEIVKIRTGKVTADDVDQLADAKVGTPWQQIVVRVRNGSDTRLTDVYGSWTVTYGTDGLTADATYVPSVTDHDLTGTILPGKAKTASLTYTIPARDLADVTVEFSFDFDHDAAVFSGSIPA